MDIKESVTFSIKCVYGDLRKSEQKAADFILENIADIRNMTLAEIADKSGVSQPTVVRMLKAAGYASYKQMKLAVVEEMAVSSRNSEDMGVYCGYHVDRSDNVKDIPAKVTHAALKVIQDSMKAISLKQYEQIIEVLAKANQVVIYGIENSSVACEDLNVKLSYLGLNCRYVRDPYLQRISAATLERGDAVVGISYSGASKDTVDAVRIAKEHGAATIILTNFKDSLISEYGDHVICSTQEQLFFGNTIFSRMSQILMIDMIYMGLIASDYEKYTERLKQNSSIVENKEY